MAEWIFKRIAEEEGKKEEFEISSAAVSYEEIGNDIYPPAKRVLKERGIPFEKHRAHRITLDEILAADYVLVMDTSNQRLMSNLISREASNYQEIEAAEAKVHLLMEWYSKEHKLHPIPEVADPWYTDNFIRAFDDIYNGCREFLRECIHRDNCE